MLTCFSVQNYNVRRLISTLFIGVAFLCQHWTSRRRWNVPVPWLSPKQDNLALVSGRREGILDFRSPIAPRRSVNTPYISCRLWLHNLVLNCPVKVDRTHCLGVWLEWFPTCCPSRRPVVENVWSKTSATDWTVTSWKVANQLKISSLRMMQSHIEICDSWWSCFRCRRASSMEQSAYRRRQRIVRCHLQTAFEDLFVHTIVRRLTNCYICCHLSLKLRFTAG